VRILILIGKQADLATRLRDVEFEIERLTGDLQQLTNEHDEHEHEERFPAYEELDRRLKSLDSWKADRYHKHVEESE
jgi:hypothetical protein